MWAARFGLILATAIPATGIAQIAGSRFTAGEKLISASQDSRSHYWEKFALGFGASILAHESAHILSALLMGYHPYYAFDHGRPTVYSGIDSDIDPHQQFIFSASGLTTQALINEGILDIPHAGGGPIERGLLAGGIGTTLFYITLGRNASVSDITFMAKTSSLSKTQISLIFGGISAIQALRISRDPKYDHFFVRPADNGLRVGLTY